MIEKIILECDWCDETEILVKEDEDFDANKPFNDGWYLVQSWFGEKIYCCMDCFNAAFGLTTSL